MNHDQHDSLGDRLLALQRLLRSLAGRTSTFTTMELSCYLAEACAEIDGAVLVFGECEPVERCSYTGDLIVLPPLDGPRDDPWDEDELP